MSRDMKESCMNSVLDLIFNRKDLTLDEFDEELDNLAEYYSDLELRMSEA